MDKNVFQKIGASYFFRWSILKIIDFNQAFYGLLSRLKTGAVFPQFKGNDCYISLSAEIKHPDRIRMGVGVRVGSECVLGAMGGIDLGDHVRISKGVMVETGGLNISRDPPYNHIAKPIKIESGVWIGANAIILGGTTIGRNSVVGAGAVVTKDIPEDTIFAGNPAREIGKRRAQY
jgi:acetyltransferase-like isoleucine patch superfamily enzyme